jgi:hypothetical protein
MSQQLGQDFPRMSVSVDCRAEIRQQNSDIPSTILVQLTFEEMVETSVSGDLELGTDSEHGPLSFRELDRTEDSLIVAL